MDGKKNQERKRVIRPRLSADEHTRAYGVHIRLRKRVSSELASIQGLCWRYGERETLAGLWEAVCMPALREHVRPYADRAREDRAARKAVRDGGGQL